jgi:AsmA protein
MLPDPQSLIRRSGAAAPLLDAIKERTAGSAVRSVIDQLLASPAATPAPVSGSAAAPVASPAPAAAPKTSD